MRSDMVKHFVHGIRPFAVWFFVMEAQIRRTPTFAEARTEGQLKVWAIPVLKTKNCRAEDGERICQNEPSYGLTPRSGWPTFSLFQQNGHQHSEISQTDREQKNYERDIEPLAPTGAPAIQALRRRLCHPPMTPFFQP